MLRGSSRHDGIPNKQSARERDRDRLRERQRQERQQMLPNDEKDINVGAQDLFHAPVKVKPSVDDSTSAQIANTLGSFDTVRHLILDTSHRRLVNLIGVDQGSLPGTPVANRQPPQALVGGSSSSAGGGGHSVLTTSSSSSAAENPPSSSQGTTSTSSSSAAITASSANKSAYFHSSSQLASGQQSLTSSESNSSNSSSATGNSKSHHRTLYSSSSSNVVASGSSSSTTSASNANTNSNVTEFTFPTVPTTNNTSSSNSNSNFRSSTSNPLQKVVHGTSGQSLSSSHLSNSSSSSSHLPPHNSSSSTSAGSGSALVGNANNSNLTNHTSGNLTNSYGGHNSNSASNNSNQVRQSALSFNNSNNNNNSSSNNSSNNGGSSSAPPSAPVSVTDNLLSGEGFSSANKTASNALLYSSNLNSKETLDSVIGADDKNSRHAATSRKPALERADSQLEIESMLKEMMDVTAPLTAIQTPVKETPTKKFTQRRSSKSDDKIVQSIRDSGMANVPSPVQRMDSSGDSSSSYESETSDSESEDSSSGSQTGGDKIEVALPKPTPNTNSPTRWNLGAFMGPRKNDYRADANATSTLGGSKSPKPETKPNAHQVNAINSETSPGDVPAKPESVVSSTSLNNKSQSVSPLAAPSTGPPLTRKVTRSTAEAKQEPHVPPKPPPSTSASTTKSSTTTNNSSPVTKSLAGSNNNKSNESDITAKPEKKGVGSRATPTRATPTRTTPTRTTPTNTGGSSSSTATDHKDHKDNKTPSLTTASTSAATTASTASGASSAAGKRKRKRSSSSTTDLPGAVQGKGGAGEVLASGEKTSLSAAASATAAVAAATAAAAAAAAVAAATAAASANSKSNAGNSKANNKNTNPNIQDRNKKDTIRRLFLFNKKMDSPSRGDNEMGKSPTSGTTSNANGSGSSTSILMPPPSTSNGNLSTLGDPLDRTESSSSSTSSSQKSSTATNRVQAKDSGSKKSKSSSSEGSSSSKSARNNNGDLESSAKSVGAKTEPVSKKRGDHEGGTTTTKEKNSSSSSSSSSSRAAHGKKNQKSGTPQQGTSSSAGKSSSSSSSSSSAATNASVLLPPPPPPAAKTKNDDHHAGTSSKVDKTLSLMSSSSSLVVKIQLNKLKRKPTNMPAPPPPLASMLPPPPVAQKVDKDHSTEPKVGVLKTIMKEPKSDTGSSTSSTPDLFQKRVHYNNSSRVGSSSDHGKEGSVTVVTHLIPPRTIIPSVDPLCSDKDFRGKKRSKSKKVKPSSPKKTKTKHEPDSHSKIIEEDPACGEVSSNVLGYSSCDSISVSTTRTPPVESDVVQAPDSSLNPPHLPSPVVPPQPVYFSFFEKTDHLEEYVSRDQDSYLEEAKRLKHKADGERVSTTQASVYLEAGLYFILTGISMERDRTVGSTAAFTMYKDTLVLIRYIGSRFRNRGADYSNPMEAKIIVLSMRCQSMLSFKLFKIKMRETKEMVQYLQDHFQRHPTIELPPVVNSPNLSTPSPHSPTSSPAATSSLLPSPHHHPTQIMTTIPRNLYSNMQKTCGSAMNLISAHELWDAADTLVEKYHLEDFFIQLDRHNGPLTMHNTLVDLVRYVKHALQVLKTAELS